MKKKLVIFTGAGISAESGISTFRDNDGLWEKYKVEDVATPEAFKNNLEMFIDFYNMRKNQIKAIEPNHAHKILHEFEKDFDVTIITQNVDDLHEKAGSTNVIHLHGEILKLRSSDDEENSYRKEYIEDLKIGDMCPDGYQLRPDVVLFGESLPSENYLNAQIASLEADIFVIIGSSMRVAPACYLPFQFTKETALIYYIDPTDIEFNIPRQKKMFFYHIKEKATVGVNILKKDITEIYL